MSLSCLLQPPSPHPTHPHLIPAGCLHASQGPLAVVKREQREQIFPQLAPASLLLLTDPALGAPLGPAPSSQGDLGCGVQPVLNWQ